MTSRFGLGLGTKSRRVTTCPTKAAVQATARLR
jgi:hypothetical protein